MTEEEKKKQEEEKRHAAAQARLYNEIHEHGRFFNVAEQAVLTAIASFSRHETDPVFDNSDTWTNSRETLRPRQAFVTRKVLEHLTHLNAEGVRRTITNISRKLEREIRIPRIRGKNGKQIFAMRKSAVIFQIPTVQEMKAAQARLDKERKPRKSPKKEAGKSEKATSISVPSEEKATSISVPSENGPRNKAKKPP